MLLGAGGMYFQLLRRLKWKGCLSLGVQDQLGQHTQVCLKTKSGFSDPHTHRCVTSAYWFDLFPTVLQTLICVDTVSNLLSVRTEKNCPVKVLTREDATEAIRHLASCTQDCTCPESWVPRGCFN